jgi:hypothetical protein
MTTEEPDTTFGGLLPEHVNVFFPPPPKKPSWKDDETRDAKGGWRALYPHCKYFHCRKCTHEKREYSFCSGHSYREIIKCPIAGIPEGEE